MSDNAQSTLSRRAWNWFAEYRYSLAGIIVSTLVVVVSLNSIRNSALFWSFLNLRFNQVSAYQLQSVFRPSSEQTIPILVVGDSFFQQSAWAHFGSVNKAQQIIQNSFDADDVVSILNGVQKGISSSRVRVCAIALQTSPLFMVRAREIGTGQDIRFLESDNLLDILNPISTAKTFRILQAWASSSIKQDSEVKLHGRLQRHVGQGRFHDPTFENWKTIVNALTIFEGRIVLTIDKRVTDFGEGSDLIENLNNEVIKLADEADNVSYIDISDIENVSLDLCKPNNVVN